MVNGLLQELSYLDRKWYTSLVWTLGLVACVAFRLIPGAAVSAISDIEGWPSKVHSENAI